jgi:hypothetical protein
MQTWASSMLKSRSQANAIVAMEKGDRWLENPGDACNEIVSYFTSRFVDVS